MEQITYAMVIQFFRYKENYQNRDVAEWLGLNNGTVSGIASGKRSLNRDITYGMFYEDVFEDMGHVSKKYVDHLYEFLKEQDALPEAIKVLYEKCNAAGRSRRRLVKTLSWPFSGKPIRRVRKEFLAKKSGAKHRGQKKRRGASLLSATPWSKALSDVPNCCAASGRPWHSTALPSSVASVDLENHRRHLLMRRNSRKSVHISRCSASFLRKVLPRPSCASRSRG